MLRIVLDHDRSAGWHSDAAFTSIIVHVLVAVVVIIIVLAAYIV